MHLPDVSPDADNQCVSTGRNTELIREYLTYLRVEKGLRPLTCEAYERDLLQFAEYLEREGALLMMARQGEIGRAHV